MNRTRHQLIISGPFYTSTIVGIFITASSFEIKGRNCGPGSLRLTTLNGKSIMQGQGPTEGLYFRNTNTIYIYQDGKLHNEHGPAIIIFNAGKIVLRHYYIGGKKLPCDDIMVRMIKARKPKG